ncbi:MAG: hypothetical protein M3Q14_01720 [bacterium]|nr:hypothetical protein [bacterium]
MKVSNSQFQWLAWGIVILLCSTALAVFGQSVDWQLGKLTSYRLFPIFGLLAFSIFLSHYIVAAARQYLGVDRSVIKKYFFISSYMALGFFLIHPSLFIGQLFVDGFGLPPGSYKAYVGAGMIWAVTLGMISLLIFLSYELLRLKRFKPWRPYLQALSDLAMILILIHGWVLGSHIQSTWFKPIWLSYGVILLVCLLYTYGQKVLGKPEPAREKE